MSATAMTNESSQRIQLLQGTLDMLILRTLLFGPAHGHQIAKHIQRTTDDLLQVEHGSLYPALHRLERKGWIAAKWELAGKDLKREFKYYRSEEHTSELQSRGHLVCRLLLEKKKRLASHSDRDYMSD